MLNIITFTVMLMKSELESVNSVLINMTVKNECLRIKAHKQVSAILYFSIYLIIISIPLFVETLRSRP